MQGPALPRARAGCAPGALPAATRRCQGLSPRSSHFRLPQIFLKPRSGMDHAGFLRGALDEPLESTVPQFPLLHTQQRCSATLTKHSEPVIPQPSHTELQRVLSSQRNCCRQGDAGWAPELLSAGSSPRSPVTGI